MNIEINEKPFMPSRDWQTFAFTTFVGFTCYSFTIFFFGRPFSYYNRESIEKCIYCQTLIKLQCFVDCRLGNDGTDDAEQRFVRIVVAVHQPHYMPDVVLE